MTRDECIQELAKLLAGLQVPLSLGLPLGAAREPLIALYEQVPWGWSDISDFEKMLKEKLA